MIEVPRGALTADEIAQSAEFFSFGTNDLTQTALGMSRDDSGSFLPQYAELEIVKKNPFATIDQTGVGQLVEIAVAKGRGRPSRDLKIGICGEHGGDPASIHFFEKVGLDYVSCSPYRVPVARLAAAQAALAEVAGSRGRATDHDLRARERRRAARPSGSSRNGSTRRRRATVWVDLAAPTDDEARILADVFHFHPLSIEDARSALQFPKVEPYPGYLYVVLHGIDVTKGRQRAFATRDVDFFVGPHCAGDRARRAVHARSRDLREACDRHERLLAEGPVGLFHRIVDAMVDHYRPAMDALEERIDQLEEEAFTGHEPAGRGGMLKLRHELAQMRRVLMPQRDVLGRLARREFAGHLRRDGLPLPRRLRPRGAADRRGHALPGSRHGHSRSAPGEQSRTA